MKNQYNCIGFSAKFKLHHFFHLEKKLKDSSIYSWFQKIIKLFLLLFHESKFNLETGKFQYRYTFYKLIDWWKSNVIILEKISTKFKFHHFFHLKRIAFWWGREIKRFLDIFLISKNYQISSSSLRIQI